MNRLILLHLICRISFCRVCSAEHLCNIYMAENAGKFPHRVRRDLRQQGCSYLVLFLLSILTAHSDKEGAY